MAGGSFTRSASKERAKLYKGRVTPYVVISCIVAAVGGSLFGYDVGISGFIATSISSTFYFPILLKSESKLIIQVT